MSCGESCRCSSDLELLWLWCRPVATALILPLAWEPPYTVGAALKKKKKKKKKIEKKNWKKQNQTKKISSYHTFPFSYLPLIHFDQKLSHQAPETILFKIINNFHLANFNGQFSDSLKIPTAVDTVSFPFLFFFFFFPAFLFRDASVANGSSQATRQIRAAAASLCHDHRNAGSETHWQPIPQLMVMPDPWPTEWGQGSNHILVDTS